LASPDEMLGDWNTDNNDSTDIKVYNSEMISLQKIII
jgi:hypothetical protein